MNFRSTNNVTTINTNDTPYSRRQQPSSIYNYEGESVNNDQITTPRDPYVDYTENINPISGPRGRSHLPIEDIGTSYLSMNNNTLISNTGSLISDSNSNDSGLRIGKRINSPSSSEGANSSNSDFTSMINRARIEACDSNDTLDRMDGELSPEQTSKMFIVNSDLNLDAYMNRASSAEELPSTFFKSVFVYRKYKYSDHYTAEIINSILFNLFVTNSIILTYLLDVPHYVSYAIRIMIHTSTLLFLMMIHCNEESIRSINIMIEFTLINSVLFNYRVTDTLTYILIQMVGSILTNLFVFSMYYNFFSTNSFKNIIDIFLTFHNEHVNYTYSLIISNIIGMVIMTSIITMIIDSITPIEYKKIIYYKLLSFALINSVLAFASNGIYSVGYNLSIRVVIAIWKMDSNALSYPDYIIVIQILVSLIVIPIITYFSSTHLKHFYNTYML